MGYLHPPPGDTPVIVMKDFGGDVRQYAAQTYAYIRSGREVRLHECRSACTLALAVPNVCVYPDGVLRFHKAYNPLTRAANDGVSDAMMLAYPPAVREKLGALTRPYKSLTGSELIRLGVRDCTAPAGPGVAVAQAGARPIGAQASLSSGLGGLFAGFGAPDVPVYSRAAGPVESRNVKVQSVKIQVAEAAPTAASAPVAQTPEPTPPAPPPRPEELASAPEPAAASTPDSLAPRPPERPQVFVAPPPQPSAWGLRIQGSAPALAAARFAPFPYRMIQKS